jgi:hypothetical protein
LSIIQESVGDAGFRPNLVSNADDVGEIQKRIIQNLYENPILVCDVSGRNANVMFELGMRLAFDKPTIIIKDDKTPFSFDTSPIEHLTYPRDLRFSQIVDFKIFLSEKIKLTYEKSQADEGYTPFLKNFGTFKVSSLDQKEVSGSEILMEELRDIRRLISQREYKIDRSYRRSSSDFEFCAKGWTSEEVDSFLSDLHESPSVTSVQVSSVGNHSHIQVDTKFLGILDRELFQKEFESKSMRKKFRSVELRARSSKTNNGDLPNRS